MSLDRNVGNFFFEWISLALASKLSRRLLVCTVYHYTELSTIYM